MNYPKNRKRKGFKAHKLNDKEWLQKQYNYHKLNTYEIATIIGSVQSSVIKALKFHKIVSRSNSDAKKLQNSKKTPKSKYRNLNDEKWLKKKYLEDILSVSQIAKLCQCSNATVNKWLKKNGIKLRSNKKARSLVNIDSKYELLNNKDWLKEQYIEKGLSTLDMSVLIGTKTSNSVRQALIKYCIPVRNISESLTHNRKNDYFTVNHEVIEGGLLGDASLRAWNFASPISYPYYCRTNKFYEHVLFNAKLLFRKKYKNRISKITNGKSTKYILRSLSYKNLKPYQERWYPEWNGFEKVIPEDINPTSIVLLHWFLDDGNAYKRKRPGRQIILTFCTEGFQKNNQQMLADKINERYKLNMKVKKCNSGTGWRIILPQSQTDTFYNIIGHPPVLSLAYKWK